MPIKIVAMPDPSPALHGTHLLTTRATYAANAGPGRAWLFIPGYTSLTDLWNQIRANCMGPPRDCLEELEIGAHGSPDSIDGVFDDIVGGNEDEFGQLMKLHKDILCDYVKVYCSGCNTGHDVWPFDSIAENLCDEVPFDSSSFSHRVSFFGTKGYKIQGTSHMMANEVVKAEWNSGGVYYPPYWNGEDGNGNGAWKRFDNW